MAVLHWMEMRNMRSSAGKTHTQIERLSTFLLGRLRRGLQQALSVEKKKGKERGEEWFCPELFFLLSKSLRDFTWADS